MLHVSGGLVDFHMWVYVCYIAVTTLLLLHLILGGLHYLVYAQ